MPTSKSTTRSSEDFTREKTPPKAQVRKAAKEIQKKGIRRGRRKERGKGLALSLVQRERLIRKGEIFLLPTGERKSFTLQGGDPPLLEENTILGNDQADETRKGLGQKRRSQVSSGER